MLPDAAVIDRLAVGLAALGRPAYLSLGRDGALPGQRSVDELRAASWEVLDAAYADGVRWVDVARSYGRAEEFLAGWLAARRHEDVRVSSKWGYTYVGDWRLEASVHEVKEHTRERFTAQLAESRDLLGHRLSLYQVHSLTVESPLFTDRALLAALATTGTPLGFSTTGPGQAETIERAMALEVDGRHLFSAVQATWNLLEPSAGLALAEAHEAGLRVLVKEALANGRLVAAPPEQVALLAKRHDVGADAVVLAAALAQPWADSVLLGPASVPQFRFNVQSVAVRLHTDELAELAALAVPAREYWAERSALAWN